MDTKNLKAYAPQARRDFIAAVTKRAAQFGLYEDRIVDVTIEGSETQLDRYRQRQTTVVVGAGVNMKVGVIYRPVKWLRLGSSYHSPNYYRLEEDYSIDFSSVFSDGQRFNYYLHGFFDYSINSPKRFNNDMAILYGK